jgi:peptidoglycan/xylan/chitin deacetylase (PgdA/CDA1 family)
MYHELELPGRALCQSDPGYVRYIISADEFSGQMRQIRDLGLRGVSVSQALKFSEPAVCITFDDGCETDLISAAPILKDLRFNATFYIVSGFIGKPGYLSFTQLQELHKQGFEIGCHSMSHPYLPDLDEAGLRREICDAKVMLEQILGTPVQHFSCPGGRYDNRVARIAKEAGFVTVATSIPRANTTTTDPFALGRVAIIRGIQPVDFVQLCRGKSLWKAELTMGVRDRVKKILGNRMYDRVRGLLLKK